jgi:hypothetical protein
VNKIWTWFNHPEVSRSHGGAEAAHAHRDHGLHDAPTAVDAGIRAVPADVS